MLFYIKTYGCQQNLSDSEKIIDILIQNKFEYTMKIDEANIIIINTCTIRNKAELKFFSFLGELKKYNDKTICVLGCIIHQQHIIDIIKEKYKNVNIIISNDLIFMLPEKIHEYLIEKKIIINNEHMQNIIEIDNISPIGRNNISANVSIIYGCNNSCSYCIVPKVKGREKSRTINNITKQIKKLIQNGYKEIVLLGQNINSYGKDIGTSFDQLLIEICKIDKYFNIRFLSSNPMDISNELLYIMSSNEKIVKHLHLPLQSGNNDILKAMNRKYTIEKYFDIIYTARKFMPNISLSCDVIVGFPGETYEQFQDTLHIIKSVKFDKIFSFIFSKRYGTKAYNMLDNISNAEKAKWLNELINYQNNYIKHNNNSMLNKNINILIFDTKISNNETFFIGKTQSNMLVYVKFNINIKLGDFIIVNIIKTSLLYLSGVYLKTINI